MNKKNQDKNEIKIESPVDLTNAILEFNQLNEGASYLGYGFENPVLTKQKNKNKKVSKRGKKIR